ncbi:MAG: hypothetical protein FJZ38_05030 [Candidatus Rokubacteria bacterium]|nr:hypothetical protein [Candidatus Rokubacteria bacterium]
MRDDPVRWLEDFKARRILAALRERALCVPCLGREVTLAEPDVRDTLSRAPLEFAIRAGERICGRRDIIRQTYAVQQPRPVRAEPRHSPGPVVR